MNVDPVIFLATLAATAGAVVSLIGAVLGSQILGRLTHLQDMRQTVARLVHNALCNMEQAQTVLGDAIQNDRVQAVNDQQAESERKWRVRFLEKVDPYRNIFAPLSGAVTEADLEQRLRQIEGLRAILPGTHASLAGQLNAVVHHLGLVHKAYSELQGSLLPRSFLWVFVVLVYLAITGVALPLAYLVGGFGWNLDVIHEVIYQPQAYLFDLFAVGIVALLAYFGYQLWELNGAGKVQWRKIEY